MGKSYKGANAWKYKKDKNFQKKQKQKQKHQRPFKESAPLPYQSDSGTDMGVQGCDDFETCG